MKIYFACSISGGRKDENVYQHLVQTILALGVEVPTAHIAESGIEEVDGQQAPEDIYERDVNWIRESACLIAEISSPSHGVGYEIAYALNLGKPVLCLYQADVTISKMISGNPHHLLSVQAYQDLSDADRILAGYLEELRTG